MISVTRERERPRLLPSAAFLAVAFFLVGSRWVEWHQNRSTARGNPQLTVSAGRELWRDGFY